MTNHRCFLFIITVSTQAFNSSLGFSIQSLSVGLLSNLKRNDIREHWATTTICSSRIPADERDQVNYTATNGKGHKKKKKKNKYAKFSKVKEELDPLEALISESETKMKNLQTEEAKKKNKRVIPDEEIKQALNNEKRKRNKWEFPDTKKIDPYDPSTYGYTELGIILGAHGVHGLVKVAAVTDFPERLCKPGLRHLKAPNRRSPREITLMEGRLRIDSEYLVKFENVGDRNDANRLRGSILYVRQEERPDELEEDEFLIQELVDLDVMLVTGYGEDIESDEGVQDNVHEDDKYIGKVKGVIVGEDICDIPGLGQDLLEVIIPRDITKPSWEEAMVLIPMVPTIVPTIDLERKVIYIDPPPGLLDLTYINEQKVRIKGFLPPAKD